MFFNIAGVETISRLLSNPTWDLLAIFFFLAFGFFYGLSAGGKRLLAVLFSIYVSILLFANFSYLDFFTQDQEILGVFLFRSAAFLTMIVLLAILFNKTIFNRLSKTEKWWQVFVLSFLETGLLFSAIFQLLPAKELFIFSPIVKVIFASQQSFFWWLVLPLLSLFFVVGRKKKDF